jgi:diketogulonate reductase-like aldo/keto reductase
MLTKDKKLNKILPVIGLGTWEITGKACTESVCNALKMGYRHIDTAQLYKNEEDVGTGIRKSEVPREDIFITTKIATGNLTPVKIRTSFLESLRRMQTDYIDLLLIHWPTESMDLKACLDTMFEMHEDNKLNYVGVSNFDADLFNESHNYGPVLTNQVKFSPYDNAFSELDAAKKAGCTLTAYSPLGRGKVSSDTKLKKIGEKYGKSPAQIALRWLLQLDNVSVIPKASSEEHLKENLDIFDFELTDEDMERIPSH